MGSLETTSIAVRVLDKETYSPLPLHPCGRYSYILSLVGNNDCIQKVGFFPWPNDIVSLHYTDDTLLLVRGDARSLIYLKLLLYEFEMMIGLKINFHKSFAYNLSKREEVGMRAATVLNCNLGSFPFTCLGLSIKPTTLTKKDWLPLTERI